MKQFSTPFFCARNPPPLQTMRHLLTLLFFGWICWIVYLADTAQGCVFFDLIRGLPNGDKLGHFGLFGMLALLLNHSLNYRALRLGRWSVPWGAVAVLTFAIAEECTQYFLPSRNFDPCDVLADLCGITVFSLLMLGWRKHHAAPSRA